MSERAPAEELTAYLDHAAATPVRPAVARGYSELCRRFPANPHGSTRFGEAGRLAVERAGRQLLGLVGADPDHDAVVWTGGGTESTNLSCLGVLRRHRDGVCVVDSTAHAALLEPCRQWARETGGECVEIPVLPDGRLHFEAISERRPAPAVRLVALCHVNNETGAVQQLPDIRAWMQRNTPQAALVVDAVQSVGKLPIPWREARIDALAVSGRKLGGPGSTGAVVLRKGLEPSPLLFGGGQQGGLRPGTVDVVGVLGFVQAATEASRTRESEFERLRMLNVLLRRELCERFGDAVRALSPATASPYILAVSFPGYEGAVLVRALADRGVLVGAGSACSAESAEPSHVLTAMGEPENVARGMLRISFGYSSRRADVDTLLVELARVLREY